MKRIALVTDVDQQTAEHRIRLLKENGFAVNHYRDPEHFRKQYAKNPSPDLIVSAVNFVRSGLKEWEGVERLLEVRQNAPELKETPILTYSVYTYHRGEIPSTCVEAMEAGALGYVYMDQWIGRERNPEAFRDTVLPGIREFFSSWPKGRPSLPRDGATGYDLSSRPAALLVYLAQRGGWNL